MNRIFIIILALLFTLPVQAQPKGASMQQETTYLAGGCFWGMQQLVRQIPGVLATEVGYTGGAVPNANYDIVHLGQSGHAESLKITFNPAQLSFRHLLFEFFRMHNPTTPHQQGNDIGSQYRSAIFYTHPTQQQTAAQVIQTVDASGEWGAKVVTEVVPFKVFYRAEDYHQDYLVKHPNGYTCHRMRHFRLGE